MYATALSILREDIPACHYMIAAFGGPVIRCADYAIYGSADLSENVLAALEDRHGCLLASHGMLVCGRTLDQAMWRATELETLARQYHLARQIGEPVILSDDEVAAVAKRWRAAMGSGRHQTCDPPRQPQLRYAARQNKATDLREKRKDASFVENRT